MTIHNLYNESMKNCLLSAPLSGAFWLIFLFILCFFGVHVVRLAKIGWKYQKRHGEPAPTNSQKREAPDSQPREEKPAAPQNAQPTSNAPPEPVYYIVERKRKRPRETYSPPKEIKFK